MKALICEYCGNELQEAAGNGYICIRCRKNYSYRETVGLILSGAIRIEGDADFVVQNGELERYCGKSTVVTIPGNVKTIGDQAFSGLGIEKVIIPESVTNIKYSAFSNCTSLISIAIPNSVSSIGSHAFSGCTSLTSIVIPESVTRIGAAAFSGCTSLTSVSISNRATSIGDCAFDCCTALSPSRVRVPISSHMPLFDDSFLNKGYCIYCAEPIKNNLRSGRKCTRCGHQYDK